MKPTQTKLLQDKKIIKRKHNENKQMEHVHHHLDNMRAMYIF